MRSLYAFLTTTLLVFSLGCNSLSGGAPSASSQNLGQGGGNAGNGGGGVQFPFPSPTPTNGAKKRVFITSTFYAGNMGGLSGADGLCQTRATAAGLGGVWISWLSDPQGSAISRLKDVSPWYLVNQTTLVFPNFASITASGPSVAINMTELGGSPPIANTWTATATSGATTSNSCSSWTTAASSTLGDIGQAATGTTWTSDSSSACNLGLALYCFEQ